MPKLPATVRLGALFFFALVLLLVMNSRKGLSAADLSHGQILYNAYCAACHGPQGDGSGPDASKYSPAPTNFTSASQMSNILFDVNEQAVAQGVPGTGMPGFGMVLSPSDMQDVIAFQRAFPQQ